MKLKPNSPVSSIALRLRTNRDYGNGVAVAELRAIPSERVVPAKLVAKFKAFRQRQKADGTFRRPDETLRGLAHEGHDR